MIMRRHAICALFCAGVAVMTGGLVHAEGKPMLASPPLAQVFASLQKPAPETRTEARGEAGLQLAKPAVPVPAAEAPPVQVPAAAPVAASMMTDQPKFQFLPLLSSATDADIAPALWPLLSSQDLSASHDAITRAVIIIHDGDRDAAAGLRRMQKLVGAIANGPAARTVIFAPLFPSESERPAFKSALGDAARNLAVWAPDGWAYGGDSQVVDPQRPVSSMLALDVLLLYLADQKTFPSLRTIVIAGAGSGGDFVQRYALYGRAPDLLAEQKLTPRFVVAAAQSYAYLTETRPRSGAEGFAPPTEAAVQECGGYQDYPYGPVAPNSYAQQTAANIVRQNYPQRDVVYLYGTQDTQPAQDQSCAAKLQGDSVKARATNYERYLQALFPDVLAQHFVALPGLGGSADKIWGSNCGISALFADGECR